MARFSEKMFSENVKAILLFLYVLLGNAVTIGIVRHLTDPARETTFHVFQLVFLTSLIATLCFIPWLLRGGVAQLQTRRLKLFGLRALLEFVSFSASFYALTLIPLPMHTALLFTIPIFGTVVAALILREHATWVTYLCVALGFAGVMVVTQPSVAGWSIGIFLALGAALGFALCGCTIKVLTRSEPSPAIAFYMLSMTALIAAPFALANWVTPLLTDLPWLLGLGVLAYSIQRGVARAIATVPFMTLVPLNFAQLVFVSIIAWLFFAQRVNEATIIGSLIILAATLANAWYSARHARDMAARDDLAAKEETA